MIIGRFLKPGGIVVLQENNRGSTAETFATMIEAAGLTTAFVAECRPKRTTYDRFYFLGIVRPNDPCPAWVEP